VARFKSLTTVVRVPQKICELSAGVGVLINQSIQCIWASFFLCWVGRCTLISCFRILPCVPFFLGYMIAFPNSAQRKIPWLSESVTVTRLYLTAGATRWYGLTIGGHHVCLVCAFACVKGRCAFALGVFGQTPSINQFKPDCEQDLVCVFDPAFIPTRRIEKALELLRRQAVTFVETAFSTLLSLALGDSGAGNALRSTCLGKAPDLVRGHFAWRIWTHPTRWITHGPLALWN